MKSFMSIKKKELSVLEEAYHDELKFFKPQTAPQKIYKCKFSKPYKTMYLSTHTHTK